MSGSDRSSYPKMKTKKSSHCSVRDPMASPFGSFHADTRDSAEMRGPNNGKLQSGGRLYGWVHDSVRYSKHHSLDAWVLALVPRERDAKSGVRSCCSIAYDSW